jgi:Leucine-rich repeat (LRR) protein
LLDISSTLSGSIPASLGNLHSLTTLTLDGCLLTGTIPAELAGLVNITELTIAENRLSGSIPDMFYNMLYLGSLHLTYNQLTGTLPRSLATLPTLQTLYLYFNALSGTVPPALTSAQHIRASDIYNNLFAGPLPINCTEDSVLSTVGFSNNQFSGPLPTTLSQCKALIEFYVDSNRLTGTIPGDLFAATTIVLLNLDSNRLTGTIPTAVEQLTQVTTLSMRYNAFSGTLPGVFEALTSLQYALFSDNALTGTVPNSIFSSVQLLSVDVSDNILTGTLPNIDTTSAALLQNILIGYNQLTGVLPASYSALNALIFLNASANHFTGPLAEQLIGGMPILCFLFLSQNGLTGSIPGNWAADSILTFIDLDSNYFTGSLPASLASSAALQSVNASNNLLSGSLPASFSQSSALEVLLLQTNKLTGPVAQMINASAQRNLATLQVSNNQLTGTLPDELFRLPALSVFAAVSNCFTGSLPPSLCNSTALTALVLDGLHSATSCQNKVFHAGFEKSVYTTSSPLPGGVPVCALQLPALQTLHLSGNGLTGTLPDTVTLTPSLQDLSLSHNLLTGTIPALFLNRNWAKLDLSYNRLTGTLNSADHAPYRSNAALYLDQNRLSGKIPVATQSLTDVSILVGNVFSCKTDHSDLPRHDNDKSRYECGSDSVDAPLYVWLGLSVIACALALWFYRRQRAQANVTGTSGWVSALAAAVADWWHIGGGRATSGTTGTLPAVRKYDELSTTLCRLAVTCAAYVIVFLIPVYVVATALYGTYTYQYAWTLSGTFQSGETAFAVLFTFLTLLLVCCYTAMQLLWHTLPGAPTLLNNDTHLSNDGGNAITTGALTRYCWFTLYLAVNFTIVVGVNVAFVIASLNENGHALTFIQIALAVFKVAFNSVAAPNLKRHIQRRIAQHSTDSAATAVSTQFAALQLFVALCNNIAIPCLVVAVISPSCFYNVFHAADKVTSEYTYFGPCTAVALVSGHSAVCVGQELVTDTTSYSPPFAYSYQCSSSFVTYYAPPFVSMCIIATFVVPLLQAAGAFCLARATVGNVWYRLLRSFTPSIMQPRLTANGVGTEARGTVEKTARFDLAQHFITLLTYFALLLTFGALFPPLALCFACSMVSVHMWNRVKTGMFISMAVQEGREDCVRAIEAHALKIMGHGFVGTVVWGTIALSATFYTLFLFDTLGDAVGVGRSFWVLIVTPLLPVCGYCAHYLVTRQSGRATVAAAAMDTAEGASGAAVELGDISNRDRKGAEGHQVNPLHSNSA